MKRRRNKIRHRRKFYRRRMARSAITGRIVSLAYAQRHPKTTVVEIIKVRMR